VTQAELRVFVNEQLVSVPAGSLVRAAVERLDAGLGAALADGRALLTDGRGLPLSADDTLHAGAIIRAVVSSRSAAAGADALS
jgi:hypothetical protein